MLCDFIYETVEGGIAITSYSGNNPIVNIPREIDGKKVLEIGDNAFRDKNFIAEVIFPQGISAVGNYAFCRCTGLTVINLPEGIREVGAHAFYNCRNIEEITLPDSLVFVGDGFIKNCDKINTVNISSAVKISPAVMSVLSELKEEFILNIKDKNISVVFPQYDYDFFVNAPAKHCTTYTVGAGFRYRQDITAKGINFHEYDESFSKAVAEERDETIFRIIFCRILNPYELGEYFLDKYLEYLRENVEKAVLYAAKNKDTKFLEIMADNGVFTAENIDMAVSAAAESGDSEISAFVLDIKLSGFKKKVKTFDL